MLQTSSSHRDKPLTLFITVLFLTALGLSLGSGCSGTSRNPEEKAVAKVNDEFILRQDLEKEILRINKSFSMKTSQPHNGRLTEEVLRQMIRRRLLLQEAQKSGVSLTPEQIRKEVSEEKGEIPKEDLEKMLEKTQNSYQEWEKRVIDDRLIEILIHREIDPKIQIRETELTIYYQEHPDEFQVPERVKVRQIVLAHYDEAKKIRERLTDGKEDFALLAQEVSLSPDAANGGEIGVFSRGQMPPEFDKVCFTLQIGEISRVVKSPYGYHIFRVEERLRAGMLSFIDARKSIHGQFFTKKREEAFKTYQKKLWNGAEITLFLKERKTVTTEGTEKTSVFPKKISFKKANIE